LYWAQLFVEGPTIRAVLGIDEGRQVEATAAADDVVETVEDAEAELELDEEELDES
jgi:hypothetical protein